LAIWDGAPIRNGAVSVAFETVSGTVDQAAGIIWRYHDPNNYYIVRAHALENNIVLYKVEHGVRLSIAPKGIPSRSYGVKHPIPKAAWNTSGSFSKSRNSSFSSMENRSSKSWTEPSGSQARPVIGRRPTASRISTTFQ
jgi:hypothetical protein